MTIENEGLEIKVDRKGRVKSPVPGKVFSTDEKGKIIYDNPPRFWGGVWRGMKKCAYGIYRKIFWCNYY